MKTRPVSATLTLDPRANRAALRSLERRRQAGWRIAEIRPDPDHPERLRIEFTREPSSGTANIEPDPSLESGLETRIHRVFGEPWAPSATLERRAARAASRSAPGLIRILCVHGVNHLEGSPSSEQPWTTAIESALAPWGIAPEIHWVEYNEIFERSDLSTMDLARAVAQLGGSWFWHGIQDLWKARSRGFGPQGGLSETLEWTAGMVVEWTSNSTLRKKLRDRLLRDLARHRPHLLLAHSLGTLVAYDTLARPANQQEPGVPGLTLATFGSQIGHPTVRSALGGRIVPIPALRHWFHLYNRHDHVFTAPVDLRFPEGTHANFSPVATPFDLPWDPLNHDAGQYLLHPESASALWRQLATSTTSAPADDSGLPRWIAVAGRARTSPRRPTQTNPTVRRSKVGHRALLVAIDDYPRPADRLAGCVNDAYLMSRLLQETGFRPQNIRILLDHRATAQAIRERLDWLLDGAGDGQDRVFFFAGHGAQIPGYGAEETVDRLDECLAPHDFDWSRENAILDDQFYELYSQLPENTRFAAIFDCCHSGGLTRDGGVRARGLTPPDDIRHRLLRWDERRQIFTDRQLDGFDVVPNSLNRGQDGNRREQLLARHGPLRKLGRGAGLRPRKKSDYDLARKEFGHSGPFMPFILQACDEGELACEYRHGSESNGAFTWFLAQVLRQHSPRKPISWTDLTRAIHLQLRNAGYSQVPQLACPSALKNSEVPWSPSGKRR